MSEAVLVALISGGLSLVGVMVSNFSAARKTANNIQTSQAVTDTKIEELTREVREHNGFARRMPVVEEQIKVINHRLADLEREGICKKFCRKLQSCARSKPLSPFWWSACLWCLLCVAMFRRIM